MLEPAEVAGCAMPPFFMTLDADSSLLASAMCPAMWGLGAGVQTDASPAGSCWAPLTLKDLPVKQVAYIEHGL